MFNYDQTLPGLDQLIKSPKCSVGEAKNQAVTISNNNSKWQEQGVQTDPPPSRQQVQSQSSSASSSSSSSSCSISSSSRSKIINNNQLKTSSSSTTWPLPAATPLASDQVKHQKGNCILLLNSLPPIVNNSALVRQRASAKDCLAAATLTAGASVPLMAGGGRTALHNNSQTEQVLAAAVTQPVAAGGNLVPKNTALRAEQRKQNNMVSVVRPVVSQQAMNQHDCGLSYSPQPIIKPLAMRSRFEDSAIWNQQNINHQQQQSILDDFIMLDKQINNNSASGADCPEVDLLMLSKFDFVNNEQQARQQAALFRREEFELNRSIKRQHRFFISKLLERKRGLQIVQAVWHTKGFRPAIERLVDIYHQGLIFTTTGGQQRADDVSTGNSTTLNSLNTSLVVDLLSVILLRPKLWNLETCQLLLPIINNDLLMQTKPAYENYLEVALKSLRLILNHFSSVIVTTLSEKVQLKTLCGVDLSREDRINKCLSCCKLLMEARSSIIRLQQKSSSQQAKFGPILRELEQLFATFESSLDPAAIATLMKRN